MEKNNIKNTSEIEKNPLGYKPIGKLLFSLAIPAIIANIVNALYNIVDQIFIGQGVGYLGNAATNIAFPITTLCLAIGLMIGIGGASNFNLELGRKNYVKAKKIIGTAGSSLILVGVIFCIFIILFLKPLMITFGATDQILSYAMEYTGITSLGIPFLLFGIGTNPLIRADRSPKYSMFAIIIGAVMNTILDPLFIFVFNMGIAGAALATVISQIFSAVILLLYFRKFKSVKLERKDFIPNFKIFLDIAKLGFATFTFQFSTMIVHITSNNLLKTYGSKSEYGSDIPIASAGVVLKINVIFIAIIIGLVQGAQPIIGFNYGAKNYKRVRQTTKVLVKTAFTMSVIMFLIFQIFPKQLISLFGSGNEMYMTFAVGFMRKFLSAIFLAGTVTVAMTFFPAIGKAKKGSIISVSKQLLLLLPILIILPKFIGLDGIAFAAPISDFLSFILAIFLLKQEFDLMPKE